MPTRSPFLFVSPSLVALAMALTLALLASACPSDTTGQEAPATQEPAEPAASPTETASGTEGPGVEEKLAEMGLTLPEMPPPIANYVRAVRTGNLVFLAGHGPLGPDGEYVTGKIDSELTVEEGYKAARLTALALLASLKAEIGDLDRVQRIVRVFGMVNSDPGFTQQPQVINGCSDLLVELFGDRGRHARAAVGMVSLPIGIAVEIEMVVEVE